MRQKSIYVSSFPLPLTSLSLGRLITQLKSPADDFFDPSTLHSVPRPQSDSTAITNLSEMLDQTKGSGVEMALSSFASIFVKSGKKEAKQLCAYRCTEYYMLNSESWFKNICAEDATKIWLERQAMRGKQIYLITGYRTFFNATIALQSASELHGGTAVQAPVLALAGGAAIPTPLDPSIKVAGQRQHVHEQGYDVPDEKVFGILYKSVKLQKRTRSNAELLQPALSSAIMWEELFGLRAAVPADEEDSEVIVEVNVNEEEKSPDGYSQIDTESECLVFEV